MTSWHGHREDEDIPAPIREVWSAKFGRGGKGGQQQQQSNVDLAILDAGAQLVHTFDGFPRRGPGHGEPLAKYTLRELQRGIARMDPEPPPAEEHPLRLPDVEEGRGLRVFVRLMDDRMPAYAAPVVEVLPMDASDWRPLSYPARERTLDASALERWLSVVFPPGVMERTDQRTKLVFAIDSVEGALTLAPAKAQGGERRAVLSGRVSLGDEGPDDFRYGGQLEVVLTYGSSGSAVLSLRGVFEGSYPRVDRRRAIERELPLVAVFESLPE